MSHTPGPWHIGVIHCNEGAFTITHGMNRHGDGPEGDVGKFYGSKDDARLISAAPELLEALIGMVEMFKDAPTLEQFAYDEPPEPRTQWDYDAILMIGYARVAISKARGEL